MQTPSTERSPRGR
jgi:hypothetical protein